MRKKINTITIILYIIFLAAAVACAYFDAKITLPLWICSLGCLVIMLIIGIIRVVLLKKDKTNTIKSNATRVVSVQPTKIDGVANKSITEELPLVHVDDVDEKKIVVSIYKNKSLATDSVGKVVK